MPKPNTRGVHPYPVYVARFRAGEEIRMSFWNEAGKPWNFERIRNYCCRVIGGERARKARWWGGYIPAWNLRGVGWPTEPPARDALSGHVEYNGRSYPDPHFASLLHRMAA